MSIRSNLNSKDHRRQQVSSLHPVYEAAQTDTEDFLQFVTAHLTKPKVVDLRVFATGEYNAQANANRWKGPFNGRPELIVEMAPSIQYHLMPLSENSVAQFIHAMRAWWRTLDALETALPSEAVLTSTAQFSELHRQRALDQGMGSATFGNFLILVNKTRISLGLKPLFWRRPEQIASTRHLPPQWQTDALRHELKHRWFATIRRLSAVDASFPTGEEIRCAFHLCLATTGWNPAVLLSLHVEDQFLEKHPKDPMRYILRGFKARGSSEQISEGLIKSQGGAGFILNFIVEKTKPLREKLKQELQQSSETLNSTATLNIKERIALQNRIRALERGVRSLWLHVNQEGTVPYWLSGDNFNTHGFLSKIIFDINKRQPKDKELAQLKPGDLRDAYAARIYNSSGGSILAVMKALNHKSISSTWGYLDNTLLREEHAKIFSTYSEALWHEVKVHRRIDPSIIAKWSQDDIVTSEHRDRLDNYRKLLRSRIGVGCKDPLHPPKRLAPNFKADGEEYCPVQRCLLCTEHAVVFPDSLPGISKRLAELYYLKANMSLSAYLQSEFSLEIKNAELILAGFDHDEVQSQLKEWQGRIAAKTHRVIEFDGIEDNNL